MNLLLVDDHPMTIDSYINLLSDEKNKDLQLNFITANSCESAYLKILQAEKQKLQLHMAFLDVSIPPYKEKNLHSGDDLAALVKRLFPKCKIVFFTMHSEPLLIDKIIKRIDTEGFISKCDINIEMFPRVFSALCDGKKYTSYTISNALRELAIKNIHWDSFDSQILLLLSQGVKTTNLVDYIPLSLSAIEKRKANIKYQLLPNKGSDQELIEIAKKIGLI